jgi:hypothetical protein
MNLGRKQTLRSSNGPIKQGSPLHRAIELIAREVARKLTQVTDGWTSPNSQGTDHQTDVRSAPGERTGEKHI